MLLLAVTISMVIFMICRRVRCNKEEGRSTALRERYQDYLAEFVAMPLADISLEGVAYQHSMTGLSQRDITLTSRRKLLADEMRQMCQQLNGHAQRQIRHLYMGFALHADVERRLYSTSWNVVVEALDEVRIFDLNCYKDDVISLVNSRHLEVRCQATIAYLTISQGDLTILGQLERAMTNWERHKILDTLSGMSEVASWDFDALQAAIPQHSAYIKELETQLNPQLEDYIMQVAQLN